MTKRRNASSTNPDVGWAIPILRRVDDMTVSDQQVERNPGRGGHSIGSAFRVRIERYAASITRSARVLSLTEGLGSRPS